MPTLNWHDQERAYTVAASTPTHLLEHVETFGAAQSGNLIIQGDNLQALKALLPFYAGRVKCIFIDPPYNTGSAFTHYDDNLEHSLWLSMMLPRLHLLRELLSEDGSIWVTIDDNEAHYLKVLMDDVFVRRNFVCTFAWQKTLTKRNDAKIVSAAHDHVLVYAKAIGSFEMHRLAADSRQRATYTNRDNDPRGDWLAIPFHAPNLRPNLTYPITTPGGKVLMPPPGRCWSTTPALFEELRRDNRIYFGRDGNGMAQRKKFWAESSGVVVPWTWWPYEETGENREATREAKELAADSDVAPFSTPKPERLLKRVLDLATDLQDLVLDSVLGSGTTAAVAHKMNRRYIGIEMGEHAVTHCVPRLQKVIAGEQGGISKDVGWQGGGGFQFATLGTPIFAADGTIHPKVRFDALAAFLWHLETGRPYGDVEATGAMRGTPLLGTHNGVAYYLLFNGILGDRRPASGNVLTHAVLKAMQALLPHTGEKIVYGESCPLSEAQTRRARITFKQIPYEIKAR